MIKWLVPCLAGVLQCVASSPLAAAGDGGLALGFEMRDGLVQRVSISTLPVVPPATAITRAQAQWTMLALDAQGDELWRRPTPMPQRFHPGDDNHTVFVMAVPAIAAGTRLTLLDHHSDVRWSQRIDRALLRDARQRGELVQLGVDLARTATAKLHRPQAGSPLQRQLALSGRGPVPEQAPAARPAPAAQPRARGPGYSDAVEADSQPTAQESMRLRARADALSARVPEVQQAALPVTVTIVDEFGSAPGQAFMVELYRGLSFLGTFQTSPDGEVTLPLESGNTYDIELLPQAPLVAARRQFSFNGAAIPAVVLNHGWILDVQLNTAGGSPLPGEHDVSMIGRLSSITRAFPVTRPGAPGLLRFALPRGVPFNHRLTVFPSGNTQAAFEFRVGTLDADRSLTIEVASAALIPGSVRAADGGVLEPGGSVNCSSQLPQDEPRYFAYQDLADDHSFALLLPVAVPMGCSADGPDPMLPGFLARTFQPGQRLDFDLLRGIPVRFVLQDQDGQAIAGGFTGTWSDAATGMSGTCAQSPCALLLPGDRPIAMSFRFDEDRYVRLDLEPQQYVRDSEHLLAIALRRQVSGQVVDVEPGGEHLVRVRVYDADDNFVISSLGDSCEFLLPDGEYRFEADANTLFPREDSPWMFRQTVSSELLLIDAARTVASLELPLARGEIVLEVDRPCGLHDSAVRINLLTPDGRRLETFKHQRESVPTPPRPPGQCASVHSIGLSPGDYALDIAPLGWLPRRLDASVLAGDVQFMALDFAAADRTQVWNVTLRTVDPPAPHDAFITIRDSNQSVVVHVNPSSQAQFELPFVAGWGVEAGLFGDDAHRGVRHQFVYGSTPPPPELVLDQIPFDFVAEDGMVRIHGDGDRARRMNIVFVAEGYTDVQETYSDLNGNGVWDGVVWYDLNTSGVFENGLDWFWVLGQADNPVEGEVPTLQNEPFDDFNDDGVLSLDDPALFAANAEVFMRSLLGSDLWREYRAEFNAYLLFVPSAQAGHDVLDVNRNVLVQRDSRFAGALAMGQLILELDRAAVIEHALVALPEADLVVGLMHAPIPNGRANASYGQPGSIVYPGGIWDTWPNDVGPSHEMGHFVGRLCDEYSLNAGFPAQLFDPQSAPRCPNTTLAVDAMQVPWSDLFTDPAAPLPTLHRDGSIGLFEGADYVFSGAYRPSFDSTMRNNTWFFNPPSRRALVDALEERAAAAMLIFGSGFE